MREDGNRRKQSTHLFIILNKKNAFLYCQGAEVFQLIGSTSAKLNHLTSEWLYTNMDSIEFFNKIKVELSSFEKNNRQINLTCCSSQFFKRRLSQVVIYPIENQNVMIIQM